METTSSGESPRLEQLPSKPRRKLFRWLVFFGVLATLVISAVYLISSNSEPEYQGVTLSKWLEMYTDNVDAEQQRKEAADAVQHIGPKAIPFLLKWANAKDSALKQKVEQWAEKLEIDVNFTDAEDYKQRAIEGFSLLGPQGKTAIPDLQRLLLNTNSVDTAARILCPFGNEAVPALLTGLTNSNPAIQHETAYAIGVWNSSVAAGTAKRSRVILPVPLLLTLATNSLTAVRELAAQELGDAVTRKAMQPQVAVPVLIQLLRDSDRRCQNEAATALAKLGPDGRSAIPVMLSILKNYDNRQLSRSLSVNPNLGSPQSVNGFAVMLYALQTSNTFASLITPVSPSGPATFTWATGPAIRPPPQSIPRSDTIVKSLQTLHAEPSEVIKILQDNLQSEKTNVCFSAINPLASYGSQARTSIPRMLQIANGENIYVRTVILHAVDEIDPGVARTNLIMVAPASTNAEMIPYLTVCLASKDPFIRRVSAYGLGNIGSVASTNAAKLLPLLHDKDEAVRAIAAEALKKINPEAAANAGVK